MDWYDLGFRAFIALIAVLGITRVGVWFIDRIKRPEWNAVGRGTWDKPEEEEK